MLELRNISKTYHVGGNETRALDDVSVAFRQKEFVAVLGMSGSGKTTFLNIIGGLDRYDSGELVIKGRKTTDFTDSDWDAYRNNSIGFVFQSYNLIMHLSIVENVEIAMTLSGVDAAEKRRRALEVLDQVGLSEHLHKKPNQLSGGQMQRVAIARALANDPEILLCDEPTGALDTTTSAQIMDLIKEASADRLVIMVTHNPQIAETYADRIIRFQDGKIISDSNPHQERPKADMFSLKKTSMSFFTALKLSFNNIRTKKGRTFLTSFASSIGIIGIAVILSLSNGFQLTIDEFQSDAMSEFPIMVTQQTVSVDTETIASMQLAREEMRETTERYGDSDAVVLYDPSATQITHTNILSDEYLAYLQNIDPAYAGSVGYVRVVGMNLVRDVDGKGVPVAIGDMMSAMASGNTSSMMSSMSGMSSMGLSSYPSQLANDAPDYLERNYDVLSGRYPTDARELVLVVDSRSRVNVSTMESLGFKTDGVEAISFGDIVGTQFYLVDNDDYYTQTNLGNYMPNMDYDALLNAENNETLEIVGVVRAKASSSMGLLSTGIAYSDDLAQLIIDRAADSDIVKAQRESERNVMTMSEMDPETMELFMSYLGGSGTPIMVMIYPLSFEAKDEVLAYLDAFNEGKPIAEQVVYTDMAGTLSSMTSGIMDGITIVLIAFAAISLVVSLIMIAIITYTSVLERTKEIGILRSLGARKKDITRVFDAETVILGLFSGILGVVIAWLLTFPINALIHNLTGLVDVAQLQWNHALLLVVISTVLTVLGGHIPARMASKRDAVEALRSE